MSVIWHDLECGAYAEDLPLWRALAAEHGDPVLDVGAGTGRVALDLARAGYRVTALDRDPELLEALARAGAVVPDSGRNSEIVRVSSRALVTTVVATLGTSTSASVSRWPSCRCRRSSCSEERTAAPRSCAARCATCARGGALAIAIAEALDLYDATDGLPSPLPDIRELDGIVYSSQPVAVRAERDGFVLERRRETVAIAGERTVERDLIRLDRLTARGLEREGRAAGFARAQRARVRETSDYVGSEVVILRAPAE